MFPCSLAEKTEELINMGNETSSDESLCCLPCTMKLRGKIFAADICSDVASLSSSDWCFILPSHLLRGL